MAPDLDSGGDEFSGHSGCDQRSDSEIAFDTLARIRDRMPSYFDRVRVVVKDGWMTLEGHAEWNHQRERAEAAARSTRGVRGISNLIRLESRLATGRIRRETVDAFRHSAAGEAP